MTIPEEEVEAACEAFMKAPGPLNISIQYALLAAAKVRGARERDAVIVYLREIDSGTDNACWVVCNKVDEGAIPFEAAQP